MKTQVVLAVFVLASATAGDVYKRVKGGRDCTDAESKQFVFLEQPVKKESRKYVCSGTVIGDGSWVLTAAHCDETKSGITTKDLKRQTAVSDTFIKYVDSNKKEHDIMLIKLNKKLSTPINLPEECKKVQPGSSKLVIVGRNTGKTDKVMCMDTTVDTNATREWADQFVFFSSPGVHCTTCGGDSGGAVLHGGILRGVFVGTNRYGYDVTMDVCHYKKWIVDTMTK